MTPHPEAHYKDDLFHCQKLKFTGHWRQCLVNQVLAIKVQQATSKQSFINSAYYDRIFTCLDCEQGKQIKKAHPFVVLKHKPKPPPQKPDTKPTNKRTKVNNNQEIPFQQLMNRWNREHGKNWGSLKQWMSWMYHVRHDGVLKRFSEEIGVSPWSLKRKMTVLGVYVPAQPIEKPVCSVCNRWQSWCKGMCRSCYQKQVREKKRREAGR